MKFLLSSSFKRWDFFLFLLNMLNLMENVNVWQKSELSGLCMQSATCVCHESLSLSFTLHNLCSSCDDIWWLIVTVSCMSKSHYVTDIPSFFFLFINVSGIISTSVLFHARLRFFVPGWGRGVGWGGCPGVVIVCYLSMIWNTFKFMVIHKGALSA